MTITNVQIQLLVSPNAYDCVHLNEEQAPYWPQPQDPRDFFVANGSSFQPTDWMLERGPPVVAFLYWDLAISHNSGMRFDVFYHYYINPPPDTAFPLHIYRLVDPPGLAHRGVPSGRIYSNCPPRLSPTPLPPLLPSDCNIRARFLFSHLFFGDDDFEMLASVQFFSNVDCTPEEGGNGPQPPNQPTLITQVDQASVRLGKAFRDEAILGNGLKPTGTITFTLYDPDNIIVQTSTVPVSGNGGYASPPYTPPTKAGVYRYKAHYSGDHNNRSASTSLGDANEQVLVVSGGLGYRDVLLRMHLAKHEHVDVPTRLHLSSVHPGIAHYSPVDASRVRYKRTKPE